MTESVAEFLRGSHDTAFSFEILPPLRGNSIDGTFANVRKLMEYSPAYVNITTHRNEVVYQPAELGTYVAHSMRKRPGTVAIAALLRERFGLRPVPHIICGGYSRHDIEDQLIDLSFLDINDILVLRGDSPRNTSSAIQTQPLDSHLHAGSLARQITDFNRGILADGSQTPALDIPFSFGVAGYPEKHEEAMNLQSDIRHLKEKVEAGASYVVTQMFYDNDRYFRFVKACHEAGIDVPVIPGIKPLTSLRQLSLLPRVFHIDLPCELSEQLEKCRTDQEVRELGVEWGTRQARELKAAGVPSIHFYAQHATDSVARIAKNVY